MYAMFSRLFCAKVHLPDIYAINEIRLHHTPKGVPLHFGGLKCVI